MKTGKKSFVNYVMVLYCFELIQLDETFQSENSYLTLGCRMFSSLCWGFVIINHRITYQNVSLFPDSFQKRPLPRTPKNELMALNLKNTLHLKRYLQISALINFLQNFDFSCQWHF